MTTLSAQDWLEKIRALPLRRKVRIMNVCGGHERTCTPRTPIGPYMVSEEGACRIWWAGGVRAEAEAV